MAKSTVGAGIKILFVDDDESIAEVMRIHLTVMYSFEVSLACNGQQALEVAEKMRPDCIITDIRMPVMDGEEFLERYTGGAPVIVSSGYSDNFNLSKARAIVAKPVDAKHLVATIMRLLYPEDLTAEGTNR